MGGKQQRKATTKLSSIFHLPLPPPTPHICPLVMQLMV